MVDQQTLPDLGESGPLSPKGKDAPIKRRGKLTVHDPFDLIRWLAMSQPDPRKAVAELVQNGLDAGASEMTIERVRRQGTSRLVFKDNGDGIIPELPLDQALRYLATHIGHSRKRKLTPQERQELMTQGQYGIGLLGFWSLGEFLEIRASRPGQSPLRLRLQRNRPEFRIEGLPGAPAATSRQTEVIVSELHKEAMPVLGARRLSDYLATELRGQLLARECRLVVHDRLARGRTPKRLEVQPRRFSGVRFDIDRLEVGAGEPSIALDLFIDASGQREPVALYAAGTLVAEAFGELAPLGLDHAPWTNQRLTGVVDYPLLTIAPGSRRGVLPNASSSALARALQTIEPRLQHFLAQETEQRDEEVDPATVKRLRKAFHSVFEQLPRYELLTRPDARVATLKPAAADLEHEPAMANAEQLDPGVASEPASQELAQPLSVELQSSTVPPAPLAPTKPLHAVTIKPQKIIMATGTTRWATATPLDVDGRVTDGKCTYLWRLVDLDGKVEGQPGTGPRIKVLAGTEPGIGTLRVVVEGTKGIDGSRPTATTEITVEIKERDASVGSGAGIPRPDLVHDSSGSWRSRIRGSQWQVNASHPSYRAVVQKRALKTRYLALLLAKDVVLQSSKNPRFEEPLEELIKVYSAADRGL